MPPRMESSQSGLLERLRAQRESMAASQAPPIEEEPPGIAESVTAPPSMIPAVATAPAGPETSAAVREHGARLLRLESEGDVTRQRIEAVEANLRHGLMELRAELPPMISAEVQRYSTATNEA